MAIATVFLIFVLFFILRLFYRTGVEEIEKQVAKIHNTKLTLDDVMGKNLPPDPGVEADKTIAGVDANNNGIRDDVELAIFKEYPNSAKTRAALLQYALALQMEVMQTVVNKETVTAVAEETSRANNCVADGLVPRKTPESPRGDYEMEKIESYVNFLEKIQLNTEQRKNAQRDFYRGKLGSFELQSGCDIELKNLEN